jgi:hypothetical protein
MKIKQASLGCLAGGRFHGDVSICVAAISIRPIEPIPLIVARAVSMAIGISKEVFPLWNWPFRGNSLIGWIVGGIKPSLVQRGSFQGVAKCYD